MERQRFFHTFFQTATRARIDVIQLMVDAEQGGFRLAITAKVVGICELAVPSRLVLRRKVIADVTTLVELTAQNRTGISAILADSCPQRLAAIDQIQMRLPEVQTPIRQIREQRITRCLILAGTLVKPENRFAPRMIDAQRCYQVLLLELDTVQQQGA